MKALKMLPVDEPVQGTYKQLYRNSRGQFYEHPGIDQPCPIGTAARLVADGNFTIYADGTYGDGSFGCCCVLDIPGTLIWVVIAHLQNQPSRSGVGRAGDVIGYCGMTGLTDGPHIHTGLSEERNATFAPMRVADGAGVLRIGPDSPLRNPLDYLELTGPPAPGPYAVTLGDVAGSLNNLNDVVIGLKAETDRRLENIERTLAGIAAAINGGRQ